MGVSDEAKNVISLMFLRKIKNNYFFPLVNSIRGHTVYTEGLKNGTNFVRSYLPELLNFLND
jgi:hypothetical protein